MLKTAVRFVAMTAAFTTLGAGLVFGAANAAAPTGDVPVCSKTVTDKCLDKGAAPKHVVAHHVMKHHAKVAAVTTKTTTKAVEHKG